MLTFTSQAALLAAIVGVASAAAVQLHGRRPLASRFALLAIAASLFYAISFFRALFPRPEFDRLHIVAAALTLVFGTIFFQSLLSDYGVRAAQRGRLAWVIALALIAVAVSPLTRQLWVRALAAVAVIGPLASLVWTMERRARELSSATERWRLRYVAVGGACVLAALVLDLLRGVGLPLPPIGGVAAALYLYFLSQILVRERLLDLHELLGRLLIYSVLALTLAAVAGLLLLWAHDTGVFVFNALLAAALILVLYEPIRAWLEAIVARTFFRRQRDFARALQQLARSLLNLVDAERVQARVLDAIYDSKRATHCAIYLLNDEASQLELASFRGPRPAVRLEPVTERLLIDHAVGDRAPLQRDLLLARRPVTPVVGLTGPAASARDPTAALLSALDAMAADLCLPIVGNARLLGLLTLGDERAGVAFGNDEIAQLIRIADLLGVAHENSRQVERLRERDRMAMLGELAAGLAHEVQAPLAAIRDALQAAAPTATGTDIAGNAQVEVARLERVVGRFLEYAQPTRSVLAPFDLNATVRQAIAGLTLPTTIELRWLLAETLPPALGDSAQIQEVIAHLTRNALQAMSDQGTLTIATEHRRSTLGGEAGALVVRVSDCGTGIAPEVRARLFTPFFTTRREGSGLGLAICKRIVEAHGGRIGVHSRVGEGTEFAVHLPLRAPATALASAVTDASAAPTAAADESLL
ncbi:MAG: hypothetical protein JXR83_23130 [Deltaproteobacteria bacterium]|nr:hypothetical protein [Deltaproteobacteria bacterium]